MQLEFHPEALTEFIETTLYYERQVPNLGYRFVNEVNLTSDLLISQPEIGQQIGEKFRRIVLNQFPSSDL